jgi:hypothetical protein
LIKSYAGKGKELVLLEREENYFSQGKRILEIFQLTRRRERIP